MSTQRMDKYRGIVPAFYACYEADGSVSPERAKALARHLKQKGVQGLYIGGSSGECIYQSVDERKRVLESVMDEVGGKLTIIAHVACNNTRDSQELAAHAQGLGVDAIAAIPPIYFRLPEAAICRYWLDIAESAPDTDFFIYNIPQLAGTALSASMYREMLKHPFIAGVKNSSASTQDIEMFKALGGVERVVMNGPDEQLVAGLAIGADGGIGGTYGVMPELYLAIMEQTQAGNLAAAREVQSDACRIIEAMCACQGNLYAVMKEILKQREGIDIGSVRPPLPPVAESDAEQVKKCAMLIDAAVQRAQALRSTEDAGT